MRKIHFKFLTRWIKLLSNQEAGGGECLQVAYKGSVIVVFCKKLQRIVLFIREMNDPGTVNQTALFARDFNYQVVHILTRYAEFIPYHVTTSYKGPIVPVSFY